VANIAENWIRLAPEGGSIEIAPAHGPSLTIPSLFVEYSPVWWSDAHFGTPGASPAFNYSWSRESSTVKAGLRVRF
jgi:hypothetical protein